MKLSNALTLRPCRKANGSLGLRKKCLLCIVDWLQDKIGLAEAEHLLPYKNNLHFLRISLDIYMFQCC